MDETPDATVQDLTHLRRCIALAREAFADGDEPFGSVLVDPLGTMLHEDRNRTAGGDQTRHRELEWARWAAAHVAPEVRRACTVYTPGEHCPLCSAGHAWVGLGRIAYAASAVELNERRQGWGLAAGPVSPLLINAVAPGLPGAGPALQLAEDVREPHQRAAEREAAS